MSIQIQPTFSSQAIYYVMNMQNDHWVKISDNYANLEEAKSVYTELIKKYPFARLGGSSDAVVKNSLYEENNKQHS